MGICTKVANLLHKAGGKRKKKTVAIILAGGSGERMGAGVKKQFLKLGGIPAFVRSMQAFEGCPYIDEMILVINKDTKDETTEILKSYPVKKLARIICGGDTRQLSALRGFEAAGDAGYVAIHDAARCLITSDMVSDIVSAAYAYKAASAGRPSTDTIKRVNGDGFVCETLDREHIWLVQTPQVFDADLYRAAAYTAHKENFSATDDCMLVEHIGQRVKLVDIGDDNIKLTYPNDVAIAEAIIARRGGK